jgi:hypothetical protein
VRAGPGREIDGRRHWFERGLNCSGHATFSRPSVPAARNARRRRVLCKYRVCLDAAPNVSVHPLRILCATTSQISFAHEIMNASGQYAVFGQSASMTHIVAHQSSRTVVRVYGV